MHQCLPGKFWFIQCTYSSYIYTYHSRYLLPDGIHHHNGMTEASIRSIANFCWAPVKGVYWNHFLCLWSNTARDQSPNLLHLKLALSLSLLLFGNQYENPDRSNVTGVQQPWYQQLLLTSTLAGVVFASLAIITSILILVTGSDIGLLHAKHVLLLEGYTFLVKAPVTGWSIY